MVQRCFRLVFGMLLGFLLENVTYIVKTHEIILENYTAVSDQGEMPCEKIEGIDALRI